jgi:hypothetical protein
MHQITVSLALPIVELFGLARSGLQTRAQEPTPALTSNHDSLPPLAGVFAAAIELKARAVTAQQRRRRVRGGAAES